MQISDSLLPAKQRRLLVCLCVLFFLVSVSTFVFYDYLKCRFFVVWNMFLAGLPLLFSMLLLHLDKKGSPRLAKLPIWAFWLFFYPNAPYMLTDLVHVTRYSLYQQGVGFLPSPADWFGLVHLSLGILTGCLFGTLSLYQLHNLWQTRYGKAAGWIFVVTASALSGVGIYIGRVMRFNTWDIVTRPSYLMGKVITASAHWDTILLYVIFAIMTLVLYLMFYFSHRD